MCKVPWNLHVYNVLIYFQCNNHWIFITVTIKLTSNLYSSIFLAAELQSVALPMRYISWQHPSDMILYFGLCSYSTRQNDASSRTLTLEIPSYWVYVPYMQVFRYATVDKYQLPCECTVIHCAENQFKVWYTVLVLVLNIYTYMVLHVLKGLVFCVYDTCAYETKVQQITYHDHGRPHGNKLSS